MSLNLTNFDDAFKTNVIDISINQSTDLYSEKCFQNTQNKANNNFSKYQNTNYRYKENNQYNSKINKIYNYQGINDGKGAGKNIDVDDKLTRGNFHIKPLDKLSEHITYERYVNPNLHKCIDNNHNNFLTSTNLSCQPQNNFNGSFNIQGITTSNYGRKNYKKQ